MFCVLNGPGDTGNLLKNKTFTGYLDEWLDPVRQPDLGVNPWVSLTLRKSAATPATKNWCIAGWPWEAHWSVEFGFIKFLHSLCNLNDGVWGHVMKEMLSLLCSQSCTQNTWLMDLCETDGAWCTQPTAQQELSYCRSYFRPLFPLFLSFILPAAMEFISSNAGIKMPDILKSRNNLIMHYNQPQHHHAANTSTIGMLRHLMIACIQMCPVAECHPRHECWHKTVAESSRVD